MKRLIRSMALVILCFFLLSQQVFAAELLIPGGQVIGLELRDDSVIVAAFDDVCGGNAKDAGLCVGDTLVSIDSKPIQCIEDVRAALNASQGAVSITVIHGSDEKTLRITPAATADGPKLGVYLRQGIAGIGTVTYYEPDTGNFGTLGHGVNNSSGKLLTMQEGNAYATEVLSVKRGQCGQPGQLKGNTQTLIPIGTLSRNTAQGVFGKMVQPIVGEPLPVADFEEVRLGDATIRSTVDGNVIREYSVEILKIYPEDRCDCRNFLLKVTDPELLAATGGIVQGMSGSPIIQDGKLVGAVTHVLVNDPTTGYGIFIENMLDAAA